MTDTTKVNWTNPDDEQFFAEQGLSSFADFWEIETAESKVQLHTMRQHIDRDTGYVKRQMVRIETEQGIFYLKRASSVSYECVTAEHAATQIIPQFGLKSADVVMYAFDDASRQGCLMYRDLKDKHPLSEIIKDNAPPELIAECREKREQFLEKLSGIIQEVHKAGYVYPDWFGKHLYVSAGSDDITLIDLERFLPLAKCPCYFRYPICSYFVRLKVWRKLRNSLESELYPMSLLKKWLHE